MISGLQNTDSYDINIADLQGRILVNRNYSGIKEIGIDLNGMYCGYYLLSVSNHKDFLFAKPFICF